jgi:hypothetical protein
VLTPRTEESLLDQLDPRPILDKVHQALENCRGSGRVRNRLDLTRVQSQFRFELDEVQIASKHALQQYLSKNGLAHQAGAICDSIAVSGTSALDLFCLPDTVSKSIREFWQDVNRAIGRAELSFQSGIASAKKMRALRKQRAHGRPPLHGTKQYIRWLTVAGWLWALHQTKTISQYQFCRILDEAGFELDSVFPRTNKARQCRLFFESSDIGDREAGKLRSFRDVVRIEAAIKKLRRLRILPSGAPEETPWRLITKVLQRALHQARQKRLLGPLSIDGFLRAFPEFDPVLRPLIPRNRS